MSVIVLLEFKVKSEAIKGIPAFLKGMLPDTLSFAGCQGVEIASDANKPGVFIFWERWVSREHYDKYISWRTENGSMAEFGAKLDGPPTIRYLDHVDV